MHVALGPQAYDILLGSGVLDRLPDVLENKCPAHSYAIITDTAVGPLYGARVAEIVGTVAPVSTYTVAAGEWNKTRDAWQTITDQMLADHHGRDTAIVALGGGVVGDLAGFVAATFRRGIPYVQVPTSLLAMIDSSIGGKTGVDTPRGKNLVGAFHQPSAVVADITTLSTLPAVQLAAGMAEALKHGAIADVDYFDQLVTAGEAIRALDPDALVETVKRSVEIKAGVVAEDEREHGRRAVLNFGHTIGHALEATLGYQVLHGEAVAIGMLAEARLGVLEHVTEPGVVDRLEHALTKFNLPVAPSADATEQDFRDALAQDKKNRGGSVRFALLDRLGTVAQFDQREWTRTVSDDNLSNVISRLLTG